MTIFIPEAFVEVPEIVVGPLDCLRVSGTLDDRISVFFEILEHGRVIRRKFCRVQSLDGEVFLLVTVHISVCGRSSRLKAPPAEAATQSGGGPVGRTTSCD